MAGISGAGSSVSSLPDGYQVPDVWEEPQGLGGTFGSINRPTAGPRTVQELPRGKHDLQLYSLGTPNGIKVIRKSRLTKFSHFNYVSFKYLVLNTSLQISGYNPFRRAGSRV